MADIKIKTNGMHCGGCEANASDTLMDLDGVQKVKADHKKSVIEVKYDDKKVSVEDLKKAIISAGYKPE